MLARVVVRVLDLVRWLHHQRQHQRQHQHQHQHHQLHQQLHLHQLVDPLRLAVAVLRCWATFGPVLP